ncbi:unnamed protein product [[Actinomadura] parvosata subsp. kistnae]|nr:unnamed protein product [Actinomadura parvosata subsp. kistnae]
MELVRGFQRAQGLDDDGLVGPLTWASLLRVSAGAAAVASGTSAARPWRRRRAGEPAPRAGGPVSPPFARTGRGARPSRGRAGEPAPRAGEPVSPPFALVRR